MSSRSMTSFGSGLLADEAFGGTSTSGVIGTEAGDGLAFFLVTLGALGGWLPELQENHTNIRTSVKTGTWISERRRLPGRLEKVLDGRLPLVAGIDQREAHLFRLSFPSSRDTECFAGAFRWGAGRGWPFPLRRAAGFRSFRLRCGFWIRVTGRWDSEEVSEFTLFKRFELMQR